MLTKEERLFQRFNPLFELLENAKADGTYFYNQPIQKFLDNGKVIVNGKEMGMYASYGYLGLLNHPRINAAARREIEKFGTGTHGVRTLAGTLPIHNELEQTIADFKHTDASITYSSGYVTNLTVISTLLGRHDYVFSDKLNHASIVDGCALSGAQFKRFRHKDMKHLERRLKDAPPESNKLVIVDAVFSMDGDIIDLPSMVKLCEKYDAWLMVDEAHSVGMLGKTGRGIEEYFGLENVADLKMGTLSKTIPSVGGYVAGGEKLIEMLRIASRAYIFSAALPPAQAAAANEAFKVILDEPERIEKLTANTKQFISGLQACGFNTLYTETAIVPVICGSIEKALLTTKYAHENGVFVLPVISPAVPPGLERLRATVTAAHDPEEIDRAIEVIHQAGIVAGVLPA
ncbi:MAG: aminotransferase class I/II-fold pyridoxal phosphate-dependent enzyme [Chloroflexota bacterium]|nr:aminotransferase class I/II-fold pyridoxal phosphate-dependent enzyme [Chloroflexota bacterium]